MIFAWETTNFEIVYIIIIENISQIVRLKIGFAYNVTMKCCPWLNLIKKLCLNKVLD